MRRCLIFVLTLSLLGAGTALAHDVQPGYLEIREIDSSHISATWKIPTSSALTGLIVKFPSQWAVVAGWIETTSAGDRVTHWTLTNSIRSMEGQTIAIASLEKIPADVIVRIVRPNGTPTVTRLNPAQTSFVIQYRPGFWHQVATYTLLGIEHILMGVDHLLFVLGLLLIVKSGWLLLKTITAFTIAHSLTLAVATLGYASAPVAPLNVAIALSILFLGPEIVRRRRGQNSLTIEHPWVIAFAFGLLHGFGFASGLTSLGLSRAEIPLALLLFNVGVEIGQLLFVGIILSLVRSFLVLEVRWTPWARWIPAYAVGSLGAFWTIQRIAILIGVTS